MVKRPKKTASKTFRKKVPNVEHRWGESKTLGEELLMILKVVWGAGAINNVGKKTGIGGRQKRTLQVTPERSSCWGKRKGG